MATRLIRVAAIALAIQCVIQFSRADVAGQAGAAKDTYQRSAEIFEMKTSATDGPGAAKRSTTSSAGSATTRSRRAAARRSRGCSCAARSARARP